MATVLGEAQEILSYCASPEEDQGSAAVLVVGYVQSGKTLSFTTLAALARENGYGIVVLLAGTTNNLRGQSQARLERDLGLDRLQRDWTAIQENPEVGSSTFDHMRAAVQNWRRRQDGLTQEDKPVLVISVLKHAGRITNAADALARLDLNGVPALIIDDESDQATPNTRARRNRQTGAEDASAIYAAVLELRKSLPHHSLVQYTATPQANLLLALTDLLNPDYAKVLSGGPGYTGGKIFFQERVKTLVRVVPDSEVFNVRQPLVEPPAGLQEALTVFLLGIADANLKGVEENRSMMVQAHQQTGPHTVYRGWIRALLDDWQDGLAAGGSHADEVCAEFRPAYDELTRSVPDIHSFDDLLRNLPERIAEVRLVEVNSTAQAERDLRWNAAYYWILIGGMKLDRGFTVEGLTVTYMPRAVAGNADVLQQRARFFGYRGSYINYCRVYLLQQSKEAFTGYVADEEFLRESLRRHEGQPLQAWKRDFILHRQFRQLTRPGVVGRASQRRRHVAEWVWPKSMHLGSTNRLMNTQLFEALLQRHGTETVPAVDVLPVVDTRQSADQHLLVSDVPLDEALSFLMDLRVSSREDSLLIAAIASELAEAENGETKLLTSFVFMGGMAVPRGTGRSLAVLRSAIHVGRNPSTLSNGPLRYSGDDAFFVEDQVTIQLRVLKLTDVPPPGEDFSAVPWIAIRLPQGVSQDVIYDLD